MLKHCFSGSEWSRYAESSTFCYRKERVDTANLGYKWFVRTKSFLIAFYWLFNWLGDNHA